MSSSSSSSSTASWPSWPKNTRGSPLLDVLLFRDERDGIQKKSSDSSPASSPSTVDLLFDDLFREKSPFQVCE